MLMLMIETLSHVAPIALTLPRSIGPYLALMLAGFVLGVAGHLYSSRLVVAVGILAIALATLLLPLALVVTESAPESRPGIYAPGTK